MSDPEFWRIEGEGVEEIDSQQEFYDHISRLPKDQDRVVENLVYKPQELTWSDGVRTIKDVAFSRVSFSRTEIRGVRFYDCSFDKCLFVGAMFDSCNFQRCKFSSTNTYMIEIKDTYIDPKSFAHCLNKKRHQNIGVHLYQKLLKNSRDEDQIEFQRDAQFLFLRWKRYRIQWEISFLPWARKRQWKGTKSAWVRGVLDYLARCFWEMFLGYGVRFSYLLFWSTITVLSFWNINFWFHSALGLELMPDTSNKYVAALYYTLVSLTTLGYGDIVPTTTLGQLLAGFQSVVGFFLFATLASMLFRRMTS